MSAKKQAITHSSPVVIGGVGGSGTRLIAQCLRELGYFIGYDLNESNDNLLFTLLFKRIDILKASDAQFSDLLDIFYRGMSGDGDLSPVETELVRLLAKTRRDKLSVSWLKERVRVLKDIGDIEPKIGQLDRWGWKEPSTHVILDRLRSHIPQMRYIHVIRNGLDMAYSDNQTQLALWGSSFLGEDLGFSPRNSLKYWCAVHEQVLRVGKPMGENFLLLNYDDFCTQPETAIKKLCDFLQVPDVSSMSIKLQSLINTPNTIGRFKLKDISVFDERDVSYVEKLGFDTGR